jgi:hypothetical protein
MFVNRHKYFRWTSRTARITFAYVVAFPALIGYLAYTTDVRMLQLESGVFADKVVGQVGYERKAERGYDCRVLGDGCLGGDWVVHMRGQEGMQSTYQASMCLEAINHANKRDAVKPDEALCSILEKAPDTLATIGLPYCHCAYGEHTFRH